MKASMLKARTELAESIKRRGEIWREREEMKASMLKARTELADLTQSNRILSLEVSTLKRKLLSLDSILSKISNVMK